VVLYGRRLKATKGQADGVRGRGLIIARVGA
jgi:hypothetical protein